MSTRKHSLPKRIALNTLGVLLIVISPILGSFPGPGGIPVFLAGLSLLALNNEWAERLQVKLAEKSNSLLLTIFNDNQKLQKLYDSAATLLLITSFVLFFQLKGNVRIILIWPVCLAVFMLLANKQRYKRLTRKP